MVMNVDEKGFSRSNLTDMWQFYFPSSISATVSHLFGLVECGKTEANFLSLKGAKPSHIFRFAESGRVAAGVESGLADGGRS
jgi:hypothetical protein